MSSHRIKTDDGTDVKWYLIDKQLPYGQVIAEYDNNSSLTCSYVYGQDRISMTRGSVTHTYQADGQGSIRLLTDGEGNVTDAWTYSAFGEIISRTGMTPNRFTYTGEQWDPNVGFYYLRARWDDPSTSTFISVDPYNGRVGVPSTFHRYRYCRNNPVNRNDPTGEMSFGEIMTASSINAINSAKATVTYVGFKEVVEGVIVTGFLA
jgi:RHS repeat-associated protein